MVRAYFNEKAAIWDKEIAEKDTTKLEGMAQRLNIKPGSTILDVGTGTGVFIPFLLSKIGETGNLIAIDFAEEMLKLAGAKGFPGNIQHIHADILCLPIREATFDSVVCYSSFPHFHNKLKALTEIARVLKTRASLFICHTSSRSIINAIHSEIPSVKNDLIPDNGEMYALLSSSGFSNIKIEDGTNSYLASASKSPICNKE